MSESATQAPAGSPSSSTNPNPLADPLTVIHLLLSSAPSTGALEVGTSFSMLLLGIAILQVWNYYRNFPNDPLPLKVLVALLLSVDMLHSVLFMHLTYHYTINGFVQALSAGDPSLLITTPWSLQAAVSVGGAVILLVQLYYCHRIRLVTDNRLLVLACLVVVGARFALNIALTVTSIEHASVTVVTSYIFRWETISTMSVGAASDLFIAACMCIGLHQRRTGFSRSDRLVDRLISYTIASGAATSILSVVMLVIYITMPTTYIWMGFYSVLAKLFSNSLLASLNQRRFQNTQPRAHQSSSRSSSGFTFRKGAFSPSMEMTSLDDTSSKPVLHITASPSRFRAAMS